LPKVPFIFLLINIFYFVFLPLFYVYIDLFIFCALSSIFLGILLSLYQFKIKRLLAYSAISHTGYMLLSISVGSLEGFVALFIYLFIYLSISLNIFAILLVFRQQRTFYKLRKIVDFSFILRSNFFLAFIIALVLLSYAGIPPLAGFFGKFFLFFSLIKSYNFVLSFFVILFSLIGTIYYIRLFVLLFLIVF